MSENEEPTDVEVSWEEMGRAFVEGVKTGARQAVEQAAHDGGVTTRQFLTEVGISLFEGHLMWRSARRGDVARTIAYGTLVMRGHLHRNLRRQRVQAERQMDMLIEREMR